LPSTAALGPGQRPTSLNRFLTNTEDRVKKALLLALSTIGFLLIAGSGVIMERPVPVLLNGKPFSNAQLINGVWEMPVEDLARAAGGTLTLEPYFQLQGNRLITSPGAATGRFKMEGSSPMNTIGGTQPGAPAGTPAALKQAPAGLITVRKAGGEVSSHVIMNGGKYFVPLADVAHAFGGTFTAPAGKLSPGQTFTLNFGNGDSILAFRWDN
jgi:hypothetical protein